MTNDKLVKDLQSILDDFWNNSEEPHLSPKQTVALGEVIKRLKKDIEIRNMMNETTAHQLPQKHTP